MMRTSALLAPLIVTFALVGCSPGQETPGPENDVGAAIKARLGPDYEVHLMTTHKTPEGVVVCGYTGLKPLPPTDKAYPFPPGDHEFIYQDHKLTLNGDTDDAAFEASIHKGCPGLIEAPAAVLPSVSSK